jgi:putative sigma-54 modulation protein
MRVEIRGKDIELNEAMHEHIERRVQQGLNRFCDRIARVKVQVLDLNGPHGGPDKSCRIEIRLRPRGNVFVKDTDAHFHAAVDRAVDRAAHAVGRTIARGRMVTRGAEAIGLACRETDPESATPMPSDPRNSEDGDR